MEQSQPNHQQLPRPVSPSEISDTSDTTHATDATETNNELTDASEVEDSEPEPENIDVAAAAAADNDNDDDDNDTASNISGFSDLSILSAHTAYVESTEEQVREILKELTLDQFQASRTRRFGTANPELHTDPFWNAMVRTGIDPWSLCPILTDIFAHKIRSKPSSPIWTYSRRMGFTSTKLPDGRRVLIAGEHEDFYDPDFCIYNDVVVVTPHKPNPTTPTPREEEEEEQEDSDDEVQTFELGVDASFVLYGYPEEVFPPTDFHTATLMGDYIYIIGCLGYRPTPKTPVYRLSTITFAIESVDTGLAPAEEEDTASVNPGPISRHKAVAISDHEISITRGKLRVLSAEGQTTGYVSNTQTFVFDINTAKWRLGE